MSKTQLAEVWLRGPLNNIPALLQPVAHALLQAREEVNAMMTDLPEKFLWNKVADMASAGFHLQHLTGVLDRLFTYADGKKLNDEQLRYLANEGKNREITLTDLLNSFNRQIDAAVAYLSKVDERVLTEVRGVGRAEVPSTVIGLLVHSAEHTMRHIGQLLVTVNVLKTWV